MTQPGEQTAEERFGAQVKAAREARGWTQERTREDLKQRYGLFLSSTAMTRLEQGRRPIRLNEVTALSKLLGLDLRQYAADTLPRLSANEYTKALEQLEHLQEREREVAERLSEQIAELGRERRELAEERWRLEAMIGEYENRNDG